MTDFTWRREAPWIALLALVAVLVRALVAQQIERYMDADTGLVCAMAKHIALGERFPVFPYGNDYMAATTAYTAAPFHLALGTDPRGLAYAQALAFALVGIPLLYRLAFAMGGRVGAIVGASYAALGTPTQLYGTAGMLVGYLDLLLVGAVLYLLALPRLSGAGCRGAVAIGFTLGLGWTANPQVASVGGALAIGWWTHGRAAAVLAGPPSSLRRRARVVTWALALAITASLVLAAVRPEAPLFGAVSLAHGEKYLRRFVALAAAIAVGAELVLAPHWGRFLARACSFALGAIVGMAPWLHAKLVAPEAPMKALLRLEPVRWRERPFELASRALEVLVGPRSLDSAASTPWPTLHMAFRWATVVTLAAAVLALVLAQRRQLRALLTLRPTPLDPALVAFTQLPLLAFLIGSYPNPPELRYFLAMWLPAVVVVAWAAGRLARTSRLALVLASAPLLASGALQAACLVIAPPHDERPADRRRLIAHLDREGPRAGYAEYFNVHDLVYLSDERLLVHPFRRNTNRQPWIGARILREAPRDVFVLLRAPDDTLDECHRLVARHGWKIADRRRFGSYTRYALVLPEADRGQHLDWPPLR